MTKAVKPPWLCRIATACPRRTLAVGLALTLAMTGGIFRVRLRTDGAALVPANDPRVILDRRIRADFHYHDPLIVLIRTAHPAGIFNTETLRIVRDLTDALQRSPLPADVSARLLSLATEHTFRVYTRTLNPRTFLDPLPTTAADLTRLRDDLRKIRLYDQTLISRDRHATMILVGCPESTDRRTVLESVCALADRYRSPSHEIEVIGPPVAEMQLGRHILADLGLPDVLLNQGPPPFLPPEGTSRRFTQCVGLVPLALALMACVFALCFRNAHAVALPLIEVGAAIACVIGLLGWCDVPVYLTLTVMPVILTAMGVADEVHIFHRYARACAQPAQDNPDKKSAIDRVMAELASPIVRTSITTMVAFASFCLSPIAPVRAFGLFTAVGIAICMLWSLTMIPALLVLLPRPRPRARHAEENESPSSAGWFRRIADWSAARRGLVAALAVVSLVPISLGISRLEIQDSWTNSFAPDAPFRRATERFNDQFLGAHVLLIALAIDDQPWTGTTRSADSNGYDIRLNRMDVTSAESLVGRRITFSVPQVRRQQTDATGRPTVRDWTTWIEKAERQDASIVITLSKTGGPPSLFLAAAADRDIPYVLEPVSFQTPRLLNRIADFEHWLRTAHKPLVGGCHGPGEYVSVTNFMLNPTDPSHHTIPNNPERVQRIWREYQRIRGPERLKQVVSDAFDRSLITVFMKDADFQSVRRFLDRVREYEANHLAPAGLGVSFAGDVAVSQTLIDAIVQTQFRSLLLSLLGIGLVASILARSVLVGLLTVMPCAFAVLISLALMGGFGIELGVATSMFAGMTLGVGVDFAVHVLHRWRLSTQSKNPRRAMVDAIALVGPAIAINAAAVGAGFAILSVSQTPANAHLGVLLAAGVMACLVATVVLLPALVTGPAAHRNSKLVMGK